MLPRSRQSLLALLRRHWKALALLLLGVLIPLLFVADLTEDVFRDEGFAWDQALLDWYRAHRTPTLTRLAQALGVVGGVTVLPVITLALVGLFALKQWRVQAWFLALSVAGATLLNILAKVVFTRPRPDLLGAVLQEPGFSFPSGHTMANTAFAMSLLLIFWRTRARWPAAALAVLWALLVGASRNYLGVHYPTDVLVGFLSSTAWVFGLYMLLRGRWKPRGAAPAAVPEAAEEQKL